MNDRIKDLLQQIKRLDNELTCELEKELSIIRKRLDYTIERGRVRFQKRALAAQQALKKDLYHYFLDSSLLFILTSPIIYALILPLMMLDLFMTIYQAICFPMYRINKVSRGDYLIIDRQQLAYLNIIEKVNCIYCGYASGLLSYGLEIASRTESFWCPIKHAKKIKDPHSRYHSFAEYGDAEGYRELLQQVRRKKEEK